MKTAIFIILDGMGVGGAPDAEAYGDSGSDTFGNMSEVVGGVHIPNLQSLGLGNLSTIKGVNPVPVPRASYGRLEEISAGKDSTTGHWEFMGVHTKTPFPTYPNGFPADLIQEFTAKTGYGVIGNKAASGTEIIKELGEEHLKTGKLIVYTSGDSVFQIAAHDDVISLEELYRVCEVTREFLKPPHNISRVIARPFTGKPGQFNRTPYRHDYSLNPPETMLLPHLQDSGVEVVTVGKIYDLYNGIGINDTHSSLNNAQGMEKLEQLYLTPSDKSRLLMLNLVDFDMLWGHRNDPQGMKEGLEVFDQWLGSFLPKMRPDDLLIISADHGNDPTMGSSDHSREHVPLIAYVAGYDNGSNIGTRKGFMDVGATFADYLGCKKASSGQSFIADLQ